MGVTNDYTDPEGTALAGIAAMERFYSALGMPVSIRELIGRDITDEEIAEMARKCSFDGTTRIGRFKSLGKEDMEAIYRLAR
ncbi:MAG: NADH-dependent alcohol dehydrogenase, partial [Duncaniella sp.]|nr:NADH-dependent alcohol dehydrogenase [Duncaniella sp.]